MSYSTSCEGPRRPSDFTRTYCSVASIEIRSRLEWLAAMRTALLLQVLTAISPPKFETSRRAPARTGRVVSVCWAIPRAASVARVVSMLVLYPL